MASAAAMKDDILQITKSSNSEAFLQIQHLANMVMVDDLRRAQFGQILLDPEVFEALAPVVAQIPDPITAEYCAASSFILRTVKDALSNSAFCSHVAHSGFIASVVTMLKTLKMDNSDDALNTLILDACGFVRFASVDALMRGYIVNSDCVPLLQKIVQCKPSAQSFGALATLARQSQEVKQQIRKGGPDEFLSDLSTETLAKTSAEEDPAGAMFFLSVWSLSELRNHMGAGSGTFLVLLKAHSSLYGPVAVFKDTILPMVDLMLDIASGVTYVLKKRFQWLAIVSASMIFNTALGLVFMIEAGVLHAILHVVTLGAYGMFWEARKSSATGVKSENLQWLKVLECVESSVSFAVGTYSILIAGYLDDYPSLHGLEAILRWGSVGTSLVTIPIGVFEFTYSWFIGKKTKYASGVRASGYCSMLLIYQGSEIWSHLTLVCFQIMTRPLGLVYLLGAQYLVYVALVLYFARDDDWDWIAMIMRITMMPPIYMVFQCGEGAFQLSSAILRLVTLAAAWVVIFIVAIRLPDESKLLDHLKQPNCMALVAIAAIGTIAHVLSFFHQFACGRWSDSKSEEHSEAPALE